jgi:HEAT repeat protein
MPSEAPIAQQSEERPPILVHGVGRGEQRGAAQTLDDDSDPEAVEELARKLDLLTSSDPQIREEAALEIEADGPGLEALVRLIYDDPDPLVRRAAAAQLEDSDTHAGVQALLHALRDTDSRVVIQAIESLEFAGDESLIPELEQLLDSRDREVRKAAEEAIEFLE